MSRMLLKVAVTALLASTPMFAVEYADFDIINRTVDVNHGGDQLLGTFDLLSSGAENNSADMSGYGGAPGGNGTFGDIGGFQLGSNIESASIAFWFSDPDGAANDGLMIKIDVSSLGHYAAVSVDLDNNTEQEYRAVLVETFDFGAEVLLAITDTGKLDWKIQATGDGAFRVDAGMLTVNTGDRVVTAPDGGSTAALLGLGMIGMAGLGRKLRE